MWSDQEGRGGRDKWQGLQTHEMHAKFRPKRPHSRYGHVWLYNITMGAKEREWQGVQWIIQLGAVGSGWQTRARRWIFGSVKSGEYMHWETAKLKLRDSQTETERQPNSNWETAKLKLRDSQTQTERQPNWNWETAKLKLRDSQTQTERQPNWNWETAKLKLRDSQTETIPQN
jgi:hypothetical protein